MLRTLVEKSNPIAFNMIKNSVLRGRISHAFLFTAPQKYTINNEWKLLVESLISKKPFTDSIRNYESYPDFHLIDGSEGLIKKEMVLQVLDKLSQTALEPNGKKILVIKNIEHANKQSVNSLLKFIEEPTDNTYIIMTTNNSSRVLSTIKSRSQIIFLKPLSYEMMKELLVKEYGDDASLLARLIGDVEEAAGVHPILMKNKDDLVEILDAAVINPKQFFNSLSEIISKESGVYIFNMLRVFFNDIWRLGEGFETSFDDVVINKYLLAGFNYAKALIVTNDFIVSQENNVNFELYKSQALIQLEGCFE